MAVSVIALVFREIVGLKDLANVMEVRPDAS
jgi:hypothetical protein